MSEAAVPTMVAALLCDQIITEEVSRKKTLVGVFDRLYAAALPFQCPIWVYIRFTDAEGKYRFKVDLQHLDSETSILGAETLEVEIKDRLAFHELVMRLPVIPLQKEGTYEFQVFANEIYVGRILMIAELRKVQQ